MAANEIAVKKYVVKLNATEREQIDNLIHTGKHPAQKLMKARILLKTDAAEGGEALSAARSLRRSIPAWQPSPERASSLSRKGSRLC